MDFPHFFIVDFPLKIFENIVIGHFPFLLYRTLSFIVHFHGTPLIDYHMVPKYQHSGHYYCFSFFPHKFLVYLIPYICWQAKQYLNQSNITYLYRYIHIGISMFIRLLFRKSISYNAFGLWSFWWLHVCIIVPICL